MHDWNVVITVHERGFDNAREFLSDYGQPRTTDYFNVLTIEVADVSAFLEQIRQQFDDKPDMQAYIARIMPVHERFQFQSLEEFEEKAREAIAPWSPKFAGTSFHVRMHRRGFKGRISSQEEEQTLDHFIIETLARTGQSASVTFDDPDLILVIETVGQGGGAALWTREDSERYGFLKLD